MLPFIIIILIWIRFRTRMNLEKMVNLKIVIITVSRYCNDRFDVESQQYNAANSNNVAHYCGNHSRDLETELDSIISS